MLRLPLRLLPVHLEVAVGPVALDPRPVLAPRPPLALLNAAGRRVEAGREAAAAERLRQVAADKLHAVAVDALRPDERIQAGHSEQLVDVPGGAVRVLPLLRRHLLDAERVAAMRQAAIELGRLRPHHPEALGLAGEVEEVFLLLGVLVDRLVREDAVDAVLAHAVALMVERGAGALHPDAGAAAGDVQAAGGGGGAVSGRHQQQQRGGHGAGDKGLHGLCWVEVQRRYIYVYLYTVLGEGSEGVDEHL